eukprot:2054679-Prymnesium_polylepis.1
MTLTGRSRPIRSHIVVPCGTHGTRAAVAASGDSRDSRGSTAKLSRASITSGVHSGAARREISSSEDRQLSQQ